jgi:hypothetical protein
MIRRALLVFTIAAIYLAIKRNAQNRARQVMDRDADAQWANEGGANAPTTV